MLYAVFVSFGSQDVEVDDFFRHCQKFDGSPAPAADIEMVRLLKVSSVRYIHNLRTRVSESRGFHRKKSQDE